MKGTANNSARAATGVMTTKTAASRTLMRSRMSLDEQLQKHLHKRRRRDVTLFKVEAVGQAIAVREQDQRQIFPGHLYNQRGARVGNVAEGPDERLTGRVLDEPADAGRRRDANAVGIG